MAFILDTIKQKYGQEYATSDSFYYKPYSGANDAMLVCYCVENPEIKVMVEVEMNSGGTVERIKNHFGV